jgi:imidazolonepropionase-like amidohydrolase
MKAQKCVALLFFLFVFGQLCALVMAQDRSTIFVAPNSTSRPIYITHVTVIDTKSGKEDRDRTVIISGNRILDVKGAVRVPSGAKVVDATGKYLIPGLWDMHVHMRGSIRGSMPNFARENEAMLPLYLANGVTGVREMGGDLVDVVLQWRSEVESGKRVAPRIATCGPKLDGAKPRFPGSIPITRPEEARTAVQRVKVMGVDFVKVLDSSPNIPHDAYLALLDEAKRQHLPVTGHVALTVTVAEVSDAGQNIEHTRYFPGCVRDEKELKADTLAKRITANDYFVAVVEGYDPNMAEALFARFAANHTWVTPTLASSHMFAYEDVEHWDQDPRRKYLMPRMLASWEDRADSSGTLTQQEAALLSSYRKKQFPHVLESVRMMHKEGVSIMAGTDTGASNQNMFPGFSLHDELSFLVQGGLTPLEALRCATLNPAKWLNRLDTLGTVEPGKLADLVLLDADPLQDIHNTTKISEVFLGGKEFDRATLDQILRNAEAAAKSASAREVN